jgi:hypothetical protein
MASVRWGLGSGADVCVPFVGNSALSGCRYVGAGAADDGVACAWNTYAAGADTVLYYPMDGNWEDSGAGGFDGTATGATFDNPGWLDQNGAWVNSTDRVVSEAGVPWPLGNKTLEFWGYLTTGGPNLSTAFALSKDDGTLALKIERVFGSTDIWQTEFRVDPAIIARTVRVRFVLPNNTWTHFAFAHTGVYDGNAIRCWVNGVEQTHGATGQSVAGVPTDLVARLGNNHTNAVGLAGKLDDLAFSSSLRYTANFAPVRYKSASQNSGVQPYVQATHSSLVAGSVPSAVSWSATTGAGYGTVKAVYIQDAALGWTQVGVNYPTSPISISGLTLASADAVRIALEPELVSGRQIETPVLDWVQIDYTPPSTGLPWLPLILAAGRYR